MESCPAFGALLAREIEEHRGISRPGLTEKDAIDDLRCLDQPGEHFAIVRRKLGDVCGDFGRRKAGGHLLEFGLIRLFGILGWSHGGGRREEGDGEKKRSSLHRRFLSAQIGTRASEMSGSSPVSRAGCGVSPKQAFKSLDAEEKFAMAGRHRQRARRTRSPEPIRSR